MRVEKYLSTFYKARFSKLITLKVLRNPRGNIRVGQNAFNGSSTPKSLGYLCKKIENLLKFDRVIRP